MSGALGPRRLLVPAPPRAPVSPWSVGLQQQRSACAHLTMANAPPHRIAAAQPYDCADGCALSHAPVCGAGGVTFQNACLAQCGGSAVKHAGACGSPSSGTARGASAMGGALDSHPIGRERAAQQAAGGGRRAGGGVARCQRREPAAPRAWQRPLPAQLQPERPGAGRASPGHAFDIVGSAARQFGASGGQSEGPRPLAPSRAHAPRRAAPGAIPTRRPLLERRRQRGGRRRRRRRQGARRHDARGERAGHRAVRGRWVRAGGHDCDDGRGAAAAQAQLQPRRGVSHAAARRRPGPAGRARLRARAAGGRAKLGELRRAHLLRRPAALASAARAAAALALTSAPLPPPLRQRAGGGARGQRQGAAF